VNSRVVLIDSVRYTEGNEASDYNERAAFHSLHERNDIRISAIRTQRARDEYTIVRHPDYLRSCIVAVADRGTYVLASLVAGNRGLRASITPRRRASHVASLLNRRRCLTLITDTYGGLHREAASNRVDRQTALRNETQRIVKLS